MCGVFVSVGHAIKNERRAKLGRLGGITSR